MVDGDEVQDEVTLRMSREGFIALGIAYRAELVSVVADEATFASSARGAFCQRHAGIVIADAALPVLTVLAFVVPLGG